MDALSNELTRLGRLMDAASLRTRVIANNLANVNTPGFTRSKVVFEKTFGEAIRRGDHAAAEGIEIEMTLAPGGDVKPDGNNVHMETEMVDLMKAATLYNMISRIMTDKIRIIRTAIDGR